MMRNEFTALIGVVGGILTTLLGGWTTGMQALLILMCIDYLCGIVVAAVFKKSKKTEDGTLESRAGWKGLCRKVMTLGLVVVAAQLDKVMGSTLARDSVVIGLTANESLSIIENCGLMGIPVPEPLKNAIEVLRNDNESLDNQ